MTDYSNLISIINNCSDKAKLLNWIENGKRLGIPEIVEAATRRLIEIEASATIGNSSEQLILEFWKSIIALELVLSGERGRTTRLNRTRQKIDRVGVKKTLSDLALKPKPSEGFFLLRDRGMLDLSAEAVILRFSEEFEEGVLQAARARLGKSVGEDA